MSLDSSAKRPRCFVPLLYKDDESLVPSEFATVTSALREAARQLRVRTMFWLGRGRVSDAWEDAIACHRVARLAGQGPLIVDALISAAFESTACVCSIAVIQHTDVTSKLAKQWQSDLCSLPAKRLMRDYWEWGERLFGLAEITDMALHGCPDPPEIDLVFPWTEEIREYCGQSKVQVRARRLFSDDPRIDWDEALWCSNRCHDRVVAAFGEPTRLRRDEAFSRLIGEAQKLYQQAMEQASNRDSLPPNMMPETIARHFANLVWQSTFSTAQATLNAESQSDVYTGLAALALGLAAYRFDHGAYPTTLAELCSTYIAEMPLDPFSNGEFRYRREEDGYLLYSVGPNGTDDGGRNFWEEYDNWSDYESATDQEKSRDDIAVHMPSKKIEKK